MVTNADYVNLSADVYNNSGSPSGWTRRADFPDDSTGFYGAVYQRTNQDGSVDTVAAIRGMEITSPKDRASVGDVILSVTPPAFASALNFSNFVADNYGGGVPYTGHSLGGAEVDYIVAQAGKSGDNVTGVTFGAIGIGQILSQEGIDPSTLSSVTNYFHRNDVANGVGQPVGNQTQAPYDPGILTEIFNFFTLAFGDVADSIEQHVISSYQNSFQPTPALDVTGVVHDFVNGIALSEVVNAPFLFADLTNDELPFGTEVEIFGSDGFDETIDPKGTVDVIDDGTGSGGSDPVIQVNGRAPAFFFHDGDFKIVAGDGNDYLDLSGSTGSNTVIAGNGNDLIGGGGGSNVIIAGDGVSGLRRWGRTCGRTCISK